MQIIGLGFKQESVFGGLKNGSVFAFGPIDRMKHFKIEVCLEVLDGDLYDHNAANITISSKYSKTSVLYSDEFGLRMIHEDKVVLFRRMTSSEIEMHQIVRMLYVSAGCYVGIDKDNNLLFR